MTELYRPTIGGRASICDWELEFFFLTKEQIQKFINLLMAEELSYDFEYEKVLDDKSTRYYITVRGNWANSLIRVAELVKEVDYQDE